MRYTSPLGDSPHKYTTENPWQTALTKSTDDAVAWLALPNAHKKISKVYFISLKYIPRKSFRGLLCEKTDVKSGKKISSEPEKPTAIKIIVPAIYPEDADKKGRSPIKALLEIEKFFPIYLTSFMCMPR